MCVCPFTAGIKMQTNVGQQGLARQCQRSWPDERVDASKLSRMDQLDRALAAHERAQAKLQETRVALHVAIRAALDSGVRQSDLVRRTGYSREYLRRIAREADGE